MSGTLQLGENATLTNYYSSESGASCNEYKPMPSIEGNSRNLILEATNTLTILGNFSLDTYPDEEEEYASKPKLKAPKVILNTNGKYGIYISNSDTNLLTFLDSSVNFDNAIYYTNTNYIGRISFTGTSSINVTSNTNGKTIIKASTLTGTVSLDVEDGVQDGDTFLIQATDNQLVITDGEWSATPSTSGNITTYTLSKAATPKPKFRMLYTIG